MSPTTTITTNTTTTTTIHIVENSHSGRGGDVRKQGYELAPAFEVRLVRPVKGQPRAGVVSGPLSGRRRGPTERWALVGLG